MKSIPAVKLETSSPASNGNPASTSVDKALPVAKPIPKSKLPVGVPPIPVMIDQKLENREERQDEVARKKEEPKQRNNADSKEQEGENGILDPPLPAIPARRSDDQVADRRGNGWFNVGPGVQEIGDELNHIRLPGYVFLVNSIKKRKNHYIVSVCVACEWDDYLGLGTLQAFDTFPPVSSITFIIVS